ncbi:MAG TPA: O-antigen ligase family protein [Verrucomicrobiae bacterium]
MDFIAVILFIILYHIRPHEWIGAAAALRPAMVTMLMALYGTFTRENGFSLALLLKTPHDWLMLAYFGWIVVTAPSPVETFKSSYSLFLYYYVIVLALSSVERIRKFLACWAIMVVVVACLAVASEFGFDPMHGQDMTQGMMKGRLILNVSIFQNPNALGHSMVPAFGMLYFLYFWKRFFAVKLSMLPMVAMLAWCLFLTVSKGAFLSAFATALAGYSFRRPLIVKVLIGVVSITVGWAALKSLPRMQELDRPSAEGGIQGRVWVFRWGLHTFFNTSNGVGWEHFAEGFARHSGFPKAPHSSYVAVGAELGKPGLCLFIAIIYACFATLVRAKTEDDEVERIRRVLFVMVVAYVVSSWMVGWSSRASFFVMIAVVGAYQRQLLGLNEKLPSVEAPARVRRRVKPASEPVVETNAPSMPPAVPIRRRHRRQLPPAATAPVDKAQTPAPKPEPGIKWNSFSWKDYVMVGICTYAVVRIWSYAISTM